MADNLEQDEEGHVILTGSRTSLDTVGSKGSSVSTDYKWKWRVGVYIAMLALFSATGGFLFGYDTGVVSGAMIKIDKYFKLSPLWHEIIVASTIGSAAVSAAMGGVLCEYMGRRPVLLIASAVFTIGAAVMAASPYKYVLLVGRVIVGAGIGLAAMVVPMYIAESAPAEMRGKLVVLNNLFITGGQFVATVIDGAFSEVPQGWRYMLGLAGFPSIVMFIGFLWLPESPRWLIFHGKIVQANKTLHKLRDPKKVADEMTSISKDLDEYKRHQLGCLVLIKRFITSRTVLLALYVGCGLQMFQQLGGINTVMYYSASIIEMAGFSDNSAIWLSTIPAFGNFIFTIVGLLLVDRLGRRKLLIGSLVGVVFGFLLLSGSFIASNVTSPLAMPLNNTICDYTRCGTCVGNSHCGYCTVIGNYSNTGTCVPAKDEHSQYIIYTPDNTSHCMIHDELYIADMNSTQWYYNSCPGNKFASLSIISLFIYIMFFAPGMGPLPWTVNSEIYPTWARSTCIAIATAVNWIFNLFVSLTFLSLADTLGQPATFGLYAGMGVLGLGFVILFVPETKGKSLEEVEQLFHRPHFMSWCSNHSNSDNEEQETRQPLLNQS